MGQPQVQHINDQIRGRAAREVCITRGFWIDRYETSNKAFQVFINSGGYNDPQFWSTEGWQWKVSIGRNGPNNIIGQRIQRDLADPDLPRVGITKYEADAYARWRGGQLPTEAQWEYAARGAAAPIYPWGNQWDGQSPRAVPRDYVNPVFGVKGMPVFTTSDPNGESWVRANHLSGNVGEWIADCNNGDYDALLVKDDPAAPCDGSNELVKGGSFSFNAEAIKPYYSFVNPPNNEWWDVGVRIIVLE
jgi:iron(II)-dependent oxidoreductase